MPTRTMARGTVGGTARAGRHSSERLAALYLDMLAAERGAGKNTLAAYGRDLADFSEHLAGTGVPSPPPRPRICALISASWRGAA